MLKRKLKEKFESIVGQSNVIGKSSVLQKFSTDATKIKSKSLLVVWPKSTEQITEVVKLSNQNNYKLVTRGGGSGLAGGATANKSVVVSMRKMNKVLKIDKRRRYVVVQTGILLDELNAALKKYGVFFSVQIASHGLATIGGMISTNAGGVHVLRFGKMCEHEPHQ